MRGTYLVPANCAQQTGVVDLWERDVELDRLTSLLGVAGHATGRLLLVRGEAGIGKSALVRRFIDSVPDRTRVLIGWCDDLATARELGPLWDMSVDEPELADALQTGDRPRIFAAAVQLLSSTAEPLVLVMEDVHWADRATLDLITVLGRRIDRSSGLLVLTYRDEELDADHRLRRVFGDIPPHAVERLALAPLSRDTVEKIATQHGRDGTSLMAQSDGNPFYLSELLSSDAERVPVSVQDATLSRVLRLDETSRKLVELVSVVPGGMAWPLVDLLLGPLMSVAESVDEAVGRGVLVVDGDTLCFKHELARRAIEASLGTGRRRELNAQVLSTLIARDAAAARIVHHAAQAEDVAAIVDYAPRAGRQAMAVQSYAEALSHLRRLDPHLELLDVAQRADILEQWSYAAEMGGQFTEATECARRAVDLWRELGDEGSLGRALRRASRASWTAGDRTSAEAAVEEAIAVLEGTGLSEELAFAHSASAQLAMLAGSADAVAKAEKALALADRVGAGPVRAHALVNKGTALAHSDWAAGDQVLSEAIEFAREIGASYEVVRGLVNRAWNAVEHRRLVAADAHIDEAIDTAFEHSLTGFESYAMAVKGRISLYRGDWFAIDDLAPQLAHTDQSVTRNLLLTLVGTVHARRRSADARKLLDEALELATASKEFHRTGYAATALAEFAWIRDELDDVGDLVLSALDGARRAGSPWLGGALAYWAWKGGHLAAAPDGIAEPHVLQISGEWKRAAEEWDALGMPFERALALSEGDPAARLEALAVLDRLGADAVAAKLRRQLRADGIRQVPRGPQHATRANPAGLTKRQSEILVMLHDGLSNAEIADRLFISARTVEHHVSAILSKLAVGSREKAVNVALQLHLLDSAPVSKKWVGRS